MAFFRTCFTSEASTGRARTRRERAKHERRKERNEFLPSHLIFPFSLLLLLLLSWHPVLPVVAGVAGEADLLALLAPGAAPVLGAVLLEARGVALAGGIIALPAALIRRDRRRPGRVAEQAP